MARNRGHRGWNVGSEGTDNRNDGPLINQLHCSRDMRAGGGRSA